MSFALAAAAAGVVTGLAASADAGPFASLHPVPRIQLAAQPAPRTQLEAGALFPAPSPQVVVRRVDVYDPPPPPAAVVASAAPVAAPAPAPARTAAPAPSPTPTDDGGGGGDG